MAQLRDIETSELLAEGTPLQVVQAAKEAGLKAAVVGAGEDPPDGVDAIYDDVGLGFDPDAVLKAHEEDVDGLKGAAKDAKGDEKKRLADAAAEREAEAKAGAELAGEATRALEAARKRRDKAAG